MVGLVGSFTYPRIFTISREHRQCNYNITAAKDIIRTCTGLTARNICLAGLYFLLRYFVLGLPGLPNKTWRPRPTRWSCMGKHDVLYIFVIIIIIFFHNNIMNQCSYYHTKPYYNKKRIILAITTLSKPEQACRTRTGILTAIIRQNICFPVH